MKLVSITVPAAAALAAAALIVSGSVTPSRQTPARAPHQHRPMDVHAVHFDGSFDSTNWSGYAATGTNFTAVTGTWKIPASTCAAGSGAEYAAFWIGLDGWNSNSVEQTGTDSDCTNGTPSYYAWYEFYPQPSYYAGKLTNLKVNDVMVASVTYNASHSHFTATITDTTSGASFSTTFTPSRLTGTPARSSAEWIAEAPSGQVHHKIQVLPLADFNVVDFGPDYFTTTGTDSATIGTAAPTLMGAFTTLNSSTMVSTTTPSVPMAVPSSPVTSDNTSFNVVWKNVGP